MPIYEYFCPNCGKEFELMRPISDADKPAPCPQCQTQGEKLISVFTSKAGFYLKTPDKGAFRKSREKRKKR